MYSRICNSKHSFRAFRKGQNTGPVPILGDSWCSWGAVTWPCPYSTKLCVKRRAAVPSPKCTFLTHGEDSVLSGLVHKTSGLFMEKHQLPDVQEENVKQPHSQHCPKPDLLSEGLKAIKTKGKNELTVYGKVGATCPSRSTHGKRGNAGGEPLWDPQHWGWGSEAVSCSSPTLGGEDRNNGRRHLAEDLRENIPSAAMAWTTSLQLLWHACGAGMGAWEDHTHQEDHGSKKKKQKPPAHIVHWHLCQTLRGGLKSLFGNTRAPHERWAGQGESETKQKRKTDSKHKWGLLVGSAGDEEENDAPSFNKPKLPVLTSCSCGVQIPQSNSHSTHEASRNDHQCPPPGHSHEEGRQMRTWGLHLLRLLSKKNYTCICRLEWKKITRQPHVYGIFWR